MRRLKTQLAFKDFVVSAFWIFFRAFRHFFRPFGEKLSRSIHILRIYILVVEFRKNSIFEDKIGRRSNLENVAERLIFLYQRLIIPTQLIIFRSCGTDESFLNVCGILTIVSLRNLKTLVFNLVLSSVILQRPLLLIFIN